jgi:hypothetical protein
MACSSILRWLACKRVRAVCSALLHIRREPQCPLSTSILLREEFSGHLALTTVTAPLPGVDSVRTCSRSPPHCQEPWSDCTLQ